METIKYEKLEEVYSSRKDYTLMKIKNMKKGIDPSYTVGQNSFNTGYNRALEEIIDYLTTR